MVTKHIGGSHADIYFASSLKYKTVCNKENTVLYTNFSDYMIADGPHCFMEIMMKNQRLVHKNLWIHTYICTIL